MSVIDLGYRPRPWQRECHSRMRRFSVLALHRRAGKTELGLMQLIDSALRLSLPLGNYYYIAPTVKQAKKIAWKRLKQLIRPLGDAVRINEGDLIVTFAHNNASITIMGGDDPDSLRGAYLDGLVIDEVAQIKPTLWDDVARPMLADRKGWALFIGTPSGINLFSELYFKAAGKPDWFAARYTVYDTNALPADEVALLREGMSATSFAREFLCDFNASGDDQLISLSDVEAAARRHLAVTEYDFAAKVIGVDPARFGDDRSVIVRRQGLFMHKPIVRQGIDNMLLASLVAQEINDWKPDAVFIDAGNGSGVIDRLRQLNHEIIEVNFGARPNDPRFFNKRAEMWSLMADWVMAGAVIPNDPDLKQELATPTYWFDAQERKRVEDKDEIKKRLAGGGSPDIADAIATTFAYPAQPKKPTLPWAGPGVHDSKAREYNPADALRKRR